MTLCSPPGSSVHGIFQAEYWGELPLPTPGDLPDDPGIELMSPTSPALAGGFFIPMPPGKLYSNLGSTDFDIERTLLLSGSVFLCIK